MLNIFRIIPTCGVIFFCNRIPKYIIKLISSFNAIRIFLLIICFAILVSCNSEIDKKGEKDEAIIEFATTVIDDQHPLAMLAPKEATLKYKREQLVLEMSSIGFRTNIYGNLAQKSLTQTVSFLNIKQACIENEEDIIKENHDYQLLIKETKQTKKIAGLKCYRLIVRMKNDTSICFDAFYTKDLGMPDCNKLTPYASVKGVLLDYRVKRMGMEMRLLAKTVKQVAVPDEVFVVPEKLKIVSKADMEKTLNLN